MRTLSSAVVLTVALVLARGAQAELIGYWSFDDQAPLTADLSPLGNDGTVHNATYVPGHTGAPGDYALDFNGSNSAVTTGASILSNLGAFTTSGWVIARSVGGRKGLWGQNDASEFGPNTGSWNVDQWNPGTGGTMRTPNNSLNQNGPWQHIAVTGDGTVRRIYIDGVKKAEDFDTKASYGSSGYGFNIGGAGIWDGGGNWFNGQIDDVAVLDHALSPTEVGYLADGTRSPADYSPYPAAVLADSPVAYWRMNQITGGVTIPDVTGNGNDGTVQAGDSLTPVSGALADGDPALEFDHTEAVLGNTITGLRDNYSVEFWLNPDSTIAWNQDVAAGGGWGQFLFHTGPNGVVYVGPRCCGTANRFEASQLGPGTVALGQWQHYVFTFASDPADSRGQAAFYRNGKLLVSGMLNKGGAWSNFRLGDPSSDGLDGGVDEVAVYDYALTLDQVRQHYAVGIPEPTTCCLLALGGLALLRRRRRA
ncbi:MAG: LamG domain-containing protein [Planctomycetota bacterium]